MDIKKALLEEHSKYQTMKIVNYIGTSPSRFNHLMEILMGDDSLVVQRAAWVLTHCIEIQPELLQDKHYDLLIEALENPLHDAVKRNILRSIQFIEIPEEWQGYFYSKSATLAISSKEPVAVRVFALQVMFNIGKGIPELRNELWELLSDLKDHEKAGMRSRVKRLMQEIEKKY